MSGIVGIVNLSGSPVGAAILRRLTESLAFRGPDARDVWMGRCLGFGHAMLRTTTEARYERQPCSLDGRVWIVADARVDGRSTLRRKLRAAGLEVPGAAPDPELILHAYRAWGEDCVRHLIGDFVFAIWDAECGRLFCARDHFGVKPFFYARVHDCLVFGNTLACLREHPGISDDLDDRAITDFLLSGLNRDEAATAFKDVRRLPPAHCLTGSEGTVRVDRYWSLPTGRRLRYRRPDDYVAHFSEHLQAAVSDRLRCDRVGVLMSGGLDSTSVAAVAQTELERHYANFDLRAYTCVYDRLFADEERHFAELAAEGLGLPIHFLVADDYALFERWHALRLPEPADEPLAAIYIDQARQMAEHCRVALTGWDGDAILNEGRRRGALYRGVALARRVVLAGWRALSLRRRHDRSLPRPTWLDAELAAALERPPPHGECRAQAARRAHGHTGAYRTLASPLLTNLLESYDPGVTRVALETRHPLLDVRLVEFVLSLPVSPWCIDKLLLRESAGALLPEAVRSRPKSPLAGDPVIALLLRREAGWVNRFREIPDLGRYVDRAAIPTIGTGRDPDQIWTDLRPLCLNLWLETAIGTDHTIAREERHEVA